jgi:hypothetical protein
VLYRIPEVHNVLFDWILFDRIQSPLDSLSRPDLHLVWKRLLLSVTLRRDHVLSSTAVEIIKWVKTFAVAKVCGDLRFD